MASGVELGMTFGLAADGTYHLAKVSLDTSIKVEGLWVPHSFGGMF